MEVWKDVKGFEGHYQVSNLGRVKGIKFVKERIIKGNAPLGYPMVGLRKPGEKRRHIKIHRLVYSAFIGDIPNGMEINHKNGIRHDNRLENLECVTRRGNCQHRSNRLRGNDRLPGVTMFDGKWMSQIWHNNKKVSFGYFKTQEEAHEAFIKYIEENGIINEYARIK